jgi:hypothetical protein
VVAVAVAVLVGMDHKVRFLELVVQVVVAMVVAGPVLLIQPQVLLIQVVVAAVRKYGITADVYNPVLLAVQVLWH